jgi:regulatory Fis family protein
MSMSAHPINPKRLAGRCPCGASNSLVAQNPDVHWACNAKVEMRSVHASPKTMVRVPPPACTPPRERIPAIYDADDVAAEIVGAVRRDLARWFTAVALRLQEVEPAAGGSTEVSSERRARLKRRDATEALAMCCGNKTQAARALGITRATLYKWMRHGELAMPGTLDVEVQARDERRR